MIIFLVLMKVAQHCDLIEAEILTFKIKMFKFIAIQSHPKVKNKTTSTLSKRVNPTWEKTSCKTRIYKSCAPCSQGVTQHWKYKKAGGRKTHLRYNNKDGNMRHTQLHTLQEQIKLFTIMMWLQGYKSCSDMAILMW